MKKIKIVQKIISKMGKTKNTTERKQSNTQKLNKQTYIKHNKTHNINNIKHKTHRNNTKQKNTKNTLLFTDQIMKKD